MRLFRPALGLLRTGIRPLILLNVFYFGVVGAGMAYGAWDPETHEAITGRVRQQAPDSLPAVFRAYREHNFGLALILTFAINLFAGSLLFITLPSLVVPFAGVLLGGVRAFAWGLIFLPDYSGITAVRLLKGLLIGLLLVLEGEGYVLAMVAAWAQGRSFLFPATAGVTGHWQGYQRGLRQTAQLYPLVAGVLAVAAVYEATLAIVLLPLLK